MLAAPAYTAISEGQTRPAQRFPRPFGRSFGTPGRDLVRTADSRDGGRAATRRPAERWPGLGEGSTSEG